ncbi:MAG: PRC-barrel domain-containing protein, partial [Methanobrevibacter sp.]|nr:PRC-barrel domain-containing protein [Methanobrevibacter sp.]
MRLKQILGMHVVDTSAKVIGKVEDVVFDRSSARIQEIIISHKNNIISNKEFVVSY